MKTRRKYIAIAILLSSFFTLTHANIPEGYNMPIPQSIMIPDEVDTRLGKLKFSDAVPIQETADKVIENLLFLRGIETFVNGIPAVPVEVIRRGVIGLGAKEAYYLVVTDKLMDSKPRQRDLIRAYTWCPCMAQI